MTPPRSLRSLLSGSAKGPFVDSGALSTFGTAGRYEMRPPRSLRSLPPGGALSTFGTAGRY